MKQIYLVRIKKIERYIHVVVCVLYDEEHGAVDALHLAVHGREREAVLAGAERQRPHVALRAGRQHATQLLSAAHARLIRPGQFHHTYQRIYLRPTVVIGTALILRVRCIAL